MLGPPIDATSGSPALPSWAFPGNEISLMDKQIEGRKTRRYSCYGPIEFRILQDWYPFTGKILNLCLDGCLIKPSQPTDYVVGDRLDLRFEVNRLNFRVQCIVRRLSPDGTLGIEILLLSDRSRKQLNELIQELESTANPHNSRSR